MLSNQELKAKLDSLKELIKGPKEEPGPEDLDTIFEVVGSTLEAIHDIAEFANQIAGNTRSGS